MTEQILIIDDDIMNLKMAEHILKDVYDVICVQSGKEGLELLKVRKIDLVLLDLEMPDMNGLKVLEAIRNDRSMAKTKVVILTASGFKTDVTEAIRLGALDFIRKPFFSTELLQRIKKVIIHREISNGRGTQFDPSVAGHMLSMIEFDIGYHMRGE